MLIITLNLLYKYYNINAFDKLYKLNVINFNFAFKFLKLLFISLLMFKRISRIY
jgi:hypothetical protein